MGVLQGSLEREERGRVRSACEPADRLRRQVLVDVLALAVLGESGGAELAAHSALSEAAPLRLREVGVEVVDPDGPGAETAGDPAGTSGVGGPDGAGEAVLGVVGEGDRLGLGAEGLDGEDRSENLLPHDPHLAVAAVEDGGLVEVTVGGTLGRRLGALSAGAQHRALGERGGDVRLDLGALLLGDQRPALDTVLGAAAEADLRGPAGEFGDEAVPDGPLDDEAAAGRADLAAVDEGGVEGLVD